MPFCTNTNVGKNNSDFTVDAIIPLYSAPIDASLFMYVIAERPFLNMLGDDMLFNWTIFLLL